MAKIIGNVLSVLNRRGSVVNEPPVISDIVISLITDTTFRVTCTINPGSSPVTPVLHYGETTGYGSTINGTEISSSGSVVFNLTGLTAYTDYYVKVVAGETELAYESVISTITAQFPSNLTASAVSESQINLAWTIGTTGHDGHRIYISTDNISYTEKGTVLGATATYNATGLTADTRYYFKVVAYKGSYESAATTVKSAFTSLMFVMRFDTTKAGSAANTVIIPVSGSGYNCTVHWGDGTSNNYSGTSPTISKTYAAQGIYTVKITGTFPRIYFNNGGDRLKLIEILNWGNIAWGNMGGAFYGCSNMICSATDTANTAAVDDCSYTFAACWLFNGDVSGWNMGNVTGIQYMFSSCRVFNKPLNSWNLSKCRNVSNTFSNAWLFNQPLGNWNVSIVTNFSSCFSNAHSFDQDISTWNIVAATNLTNMFFNSLSTTNYDRLLTGWSLLNVASNLTIRIGITQYSASSVASRAVLTGKGWTITDGGQIGTSVFNKGKLLITWDDLYSEQYTNGMPIYAAEGVKATHYIVAGWVGTATRLTWAQLMEMHAAGHDIQCHTNDHTVLTTLNQSQIEANLTAVNNAFVAQSLPSPRHLAYPIGTYNANVKTWVASLRDTGRDDEMNEVYGVRPNSDKYALSTHIMDNLSDENYAVLLNRIAKAADAKTAYIVCGHGLNATGDTYSTKIAHLQGIIDKAQELGMDIITMSQLYSLMT